MDEAKTLDEAFSEEELFNKNVDEMDEDEMKKYIGVLRTRRVAPRPKKKKVGVSKKEKDKAAFLALIAGGSVEKGEENE